MSEGVLRRTPFNPRSLRGSESRFARRLWLMALLLSTVEELAARHEVSSVPRCLCG